MTVKSTTIKLCTALVSRSGCQPLDNGGLLKSAVFSIAINYRLFLSLIRRFTVVALYVYIAHWIDNCIPYTIHVVDIYHIDVITAPENIPHGAFLEPQKCAQPQ